MNYSALVESTIARAVKMVRRDRFQRWVTLDGVIHKFPVPFRDAVSVYCLPGGAVNYTYRPRALAHSAIGAL